MLPNGDIENQIGRHTVATVLRTRLQLLRFLLTEYRSFLQEKKIWQTVRSRPEKKEYIIRIYSAISCLHNITL
jgi:hypothetical protein